MAYTRITKDEYQILGNYGDQYGYEEVTSEETFTAARDRLNEYRENEPGIPFMINMIRIPIN